MMYFERMRFRFYVSVLWNETNFTCNNAIIFDTSSNSFQPCSIFSPLICGVTDYPAPMSFLFDQAIDLHTSILSLKQLCTHFPSKHTGTHFLVLFMVQRVSTNPPSPSPPFVGMDVTLTINVLKSKRHKPIFLKRFAAFWKWWNDWIK